MCFESGDEMFRSASQRDSIIADNCKCSSHSGGLYVRVCLRWYHLLWSATRQMLLSQRYLGKYKYWFAKEAAC